MSYSSSNTIIEDRNGEKNLFYHRIIRLQRKIKITMRIRFINPTTQSYFVFILSIHCKCISINWKKKKYVHVDGSSKNREKWLFVCVYFTSLKRAHNIMNHEVFTLVFFTRIALLLYFVLWKVFVFFAFAFAFHSQVISIKNIESETFHFYMLDN